MAIVKSDAAKQRRNRVIRWSVLGLILVWVTFMGLLHQNPVFGWTPPGVDALCPFGALEGLLSWVASGQILPKLAASAFILMFASLLTAILWRRAFCGQVCSLGFLQELMGKLGRKLFPKRMSLPAWLDKPLRYAKYLVLAGILVLTWVAAELVIRPFDPWVAYQHLSSAELFTELGWGFGLLLLGLVGSLFSERFFCKYLCPLGAALGLASKLGVYRIRRTEATCIDCGRCDKACPVDLKVSKMTQVTSAECLSCSACVNACPVKNTLDYQGPKNTKLSPWVLTLGTVAIYALVIVGATAAGQFEWAKVGLVESTPAAAEADVIGGLNLAFDVGTLKGRHTLSEVAEATGIPLADLLEHFGVSPEDAGLSVKTLGEKYSFGETEEVRAFIRERLEAAR